MNTQSRTTVTVGIPAHNEEANIRRLLETILAQKGEFALSKVVVILDGCTDQTRDIALQFQKTCPLLTVLDDGTRKGKPVRLNELYAMNTSEVLVTLDGDNVLAREDSLAHLVAPFADPKVGLVGGADRPQKAETFFESIAITVVDLWYLMRRDYNRGDTVHNCHARILALRDAFAKKVEMPADTGGDDPFLYFSAKRLGWEFRFAEKALLYYREPATLRDYIKQRRRFHSLNEQTREYFGKWVDPYYVPLPSYLKWQALRTLAVRRPLRLALALLLEIFMRIHIRLSKPVAEGGMWNIAQSTKR